MGKTVFLWGRFTVLLVATACAAPATTHPSAAMPVGSCHVMSQPEELYALSDVRPPVPCTQPHQTETYLVTRLSGPMADTPIRPPHELLVPMVTAGCDYRPIRPYLAAGPHDAQWGVSVWGKVPTPDEWAAGDRTLRCDLLVPTTHPNGGPVLTAPLRGIMNRPESAAIRRCNLDGRDVQCSLPHEWEWVEPQGLTRNRCRANAAMFAGRLRGLRIRLGPDRSCWVGQERHHITVGTLREGMAA
ncbi:septum formation family protein [Herbidospora sp. NBRC 101105]|uniref:septum formation family protein n=1 Tax=Herbidospora sp. NBRC 101105 TaxID=3032195 RepID=UPI0024A53D5C|nr:septum formation family protein [Herbidospora sp. NBRC 101105]GLX95994.1 hypothetical protein Hesp01_39440 [Herbidospora sp. NBRC 101105]